MPRLILILALLGALALGAAAPARAGQANPADQLLAYPIDAYRYDYARGCTMKEQPGAQALEAWLAEHVPEGRSWGIESCRRVAGSRSWSLHAEGRAIDWRLDAGHPGQKKAGDRLVSLLLRPDRRGQPDALARRMGIQEIIWNCRIWTQRSKRLRPYSACRNPGVGKTIAHRDHVHLGLNWRGALLKTTFWRYYEDRPPEE